MESLDQIAGIMSDSADILTAIVALIQLFVSGVGLIVAILCAILVFLVAIAEYVLQAIPVYKLAKKTKTKYAWLAWIPLYCEFFRAYLLADMAGNKPFSLFGGKIKVKNRRNAFWAYLIVGVSSELIISVLTFILSTVLPGVASILGAFVMLLPGVFRAFIEYVFLRDVLDMFKPDKSANNTAAIVITFLDHTVTDGWAQTIWLYTLLKRKPLPQKEPVVDAAN